MDSRQTTSPEPRAAVRRHGSPHRSHHMHHRIVLYTGDVAVSASPAVLETLLGSCVAVCLFDPGRQIGGMNHILLPNGANSAEDMRSGRLGVHAMELLINQMMRQGADRRTLVAKAFGGGHVFDGMSSVRIGDMNAEFVCRFLQTERIPLLAQRLGGTHAVHVYFHTDTGKAIVRTVDGSTLPKIVHNEDVYRNSRPASAQDDGEVTLF